MSFLHCLCSSICSHVHGWYIETCIHCIRTCNNACWRCKAKLRVYRSLCSEVWINNLLFKICRFLCFLTWFGIVRGYVKKFATPQDGTFSKLINRHKPTMHLQPIIRAETGEATVVTSRLKKQKLVYLWLMNQKVFLKRMKNALYNLLLSHCSLSLHF